MITARVICDSVSEGYRLTTVELEYPRYIHCELLTHRVFSRNAASSRAIKISKMIEHITQNPAMPIWTLDQPGMQGKFVTDDQLFEECDEIWLEAMFDAGRHAIQLMNRGIHKQNVNRLMEPFQIIKTVVTATEFNNFMALRDHKDATPELGVLARRIKDARDDSTPMLLAAGEWHTPYVDRKRVKGQLVYHIDGQTLTTQEALQVSSSCCAQVSFRLLDQSLEKAVKLHDRLVRSKPVHASPFEHQATPCMFDTRNFRGWQQYRTQLEGETVYG